VADVADCSHPVAPGDAAVAAVAAVATGSITAIAKAEEQATHCSN